MKKRISGHNKLFFNNKIKYAYKILVEVMGIEPMSQRVYHPVYFYSLI